jgi:hypothetical protein
VSDSRGIVDRDVKPQNIRFALMWEGATLRVGARDEASWAWLVKNQTVAARAIEAMQPVMRCVRVEDRQMKNLALRIQQEFHTQWQAHALAEGEDARLTFEVRACRFEPAVSRQGWLVEIP